MYTPLTEASMLNDAKAQRAAVHTVTAEEDNQHDF